MCDACSWDTYAVDLKEMIASGRYGYADSRNLERVLKRINKSHHISPLDRQFMAQIRAFYDRHPKGYIIAPVKKLRRRRRSKKRPSRKPDSPHSASITEAPRPHRWRPQRTCSKCQNPIFPDDDLPEQCPYCADCYREINFNQIPHVTDPRGRKWVRRRKKGPPEEEV